MNICAVDGCEIHFAPPFGILKHCHWNELTLEIYQRSWLHSHGFTSSSICLSTLENKTCTIMLDSLQTPTGKVIHIHSRKLMIVRSFAKGSRMISCNHLSTCPECSGVESRGWTRAIAPGRSPRAALAPYGTGRRSGT